MNADADDDTAASALRGDPLWDDWDSPPRVPAVPDLHLAGFDGPLDLLLDLAERERIDLSRISVSDMVDQFVAAMARTERHVPLERRADWLNLAARLLLLWSRLFLPQSPEAEKAALDEAERDRGRLQTRHFLRAGTAWLDARPQLGRDVFARPRRERDPRVASYMRLMEACLAALEMEEAQERPALAQVYTPVVHALFRIPDALARMRATLADLEAPMKLTGFLPRMPDAVAERELVARSAVASTLFATLELARTAELVLGEGDLFEEVTCNASHDLQEPLVSARSRKQSPIPSEPADRSPVRSRAVAVR